MKQWRGVGTEPETKKMVVGSGSSLVYSRNHIALNGLRGVHVLGDVLPSQLEIRILGVQLEDLIVQAIDFGVVIIEGLVLASKRTPK
jgi:hypothetical protein